MTSPKSPRHPTPGRGSLPKAKSGPAVPLGVRIAPDLHAFVRSQPGTQRETVEAGLRLLRDGPQWTRITDDPETWPPPDDSPVLSIPAGLDIDHATEGRAKHVRDVAMYHEGAHWLPLPPLPETPEGGSNE